MKNHSPSKINEKCTAICRAAENGGAKLDQKDAPSSTVTKTLASGPSAIAAMFLRFSNGNVNDLLLEDTEGSYEDHKVFVLTSQDQRQTLDFLQGLAASFHLA